MPRFQDLTGKRFGRLTVLEHIGRNNSKRQVWECLCDCGNIHTADSAALTKARTTSCGCYLKERITKHGGSGNASYNTWRAMLRRCYNPKDKDYPKYGGRGIVVHDAWRVYTTFAVEMGEPTGNQTLDRIDPYGSYTPDNCRWASLAQQARNIRDKPSKSGHRGIYAMENGKWMAAITVNRKKYYGKCRDTLGAALSDRKQLEQLHWGYN
jgi:hypothetical protein